MNTALPHVHETFTLPGAVQKRRHVHFQPITGENNDILFRTAEYLASGYFHNSIITRVEHEKKK